MKNAVVVSSRTLPVLLAAILGWFAFVATVARPAFADDAKPAAAAKKSPWTPEEVVNQEDAREFQISPDVKSAVWVKGGADKEKDERVSNLFLSNLSDGKQIQLTRGAFQVSQPRFSPSGETIAFLSSQPLLKSKPDLAPLQLWLINTSGGAPWSVTEFERGIEQIQWLDNDMILFSAEEDASLYERQTKERKDDSNVVDDTPHTAPIRLFKFSIKDQKVTRLTDNADRIENFELSHDKKQLVAVASRELSFAWDQKIPPVTYLVNINTGERTEIFTGERIQPNDIEWARDNSGFYVVAPFTNDPKFFVATVERVYFYDVAAAKTVDVNLDWDRGFARSLEPTSDGFIALLMDGVYTKPVRFTRHGGTWSRKSLSSDDLRHYFSFALGEDGKTLIYEYSTASTPTQFFRARLDGVKIYSPLQITDLNSGFKNKPIAKTEVLHWKGANDDEVEGILYYPNDYKAGKTYPLVTATHGGPAGNDQDRWSQSWAYAPNLLTQRGAFVLKTNYHGSTGYGLKWVESICCGKYYELEIPDIERGVDNLIEKGFVDPDRIGAMGWSNGSILTIQLTITNPDRYKVASVGAGDVEWLSDWANVDFGESFDHYYFGKTPLEDPQLYIDKSPLFKLDRVKTPTLIFFGTIDRQVPTEQGWTHYRALYTLGKAPVKFILFPGEAHGPRKLSHQLRKINEEDAWLDQYLFKINPPENEALKKGSPLDVALRRRTVQKSGALYGVAFHAPAAASDNPPPDILIPETVKRGEIELGRFEVTRAQYAAFDKDYKVEPGTENYPANGISFDQAKNYCAWLAKLTSETYRLPNEAEVAALFKDRTGENTLDYWAGYPLNPEDAAKLEAEIKMLHGDAPLLREVGTFPGQGEKDEELIFDLGGNVSEWIVGSNGSPKTAGLSADRPADARSQYREADPPYTGFRVVHIAAPPVAATAPAPAPAERPARTPRTTKRKPARPAPPEARPAPTPQQEKPAAPDAAPAPEPEKPATPDAAPKPDDSATPQNPAPAPQDQTTPSPAPAAQNQDTPAPPPSTPAPDPSQTPAPDSTPAPNPQ
ncbi:MAG TPA: prolyl oligopeptidase family serine peptidase [Candidatus Acidoferrales bacterium]